MRQLIFSLFFFLFLLPYSYSQSVISGKVEDEDGEELRGATVMISRDSTSNILAYGISGPGGKFQVETKSALDSLFLKISYIGYRTWARAIQNNDQRLEIQLTPSSEELKEVLVEARIIEQRGDTLSFSVSAFKDQKDRVIADVIKKMPGIEMRPGGQIYYNGKPIQKYYIEGLDLLEGRYNLANENLAADDVSRVEILENHQPVKVLDSLEFSERASLNIRLKNNVTTSGTAEVGAGFPPLLWKAKVTPMLFTKKQQAIVTYQSNNTGSDVSREIRDFSVEAFGDKFNISQDQWLSVQELSNPPFSEERWLDNNVHLGSINFLQRIKGEVDLKVNLSYLNDIQEEKGLTQTSIFTPVDTVLLRERTHNEMFISSLQSKFTLEKNTKENYLKNQLELNASQDSRRGLIQRSEGQVFQNLSNPFRAVRNKLRMLNTFGKQLITFRSNTGYTNSNQELEVVPGQFAGLLNRGDRYAEINQHLESSRFFTDNSAGLTKALGRFTISPELGFAIQNRRLESNLFINAENRELEDDFKNRLTFFTSEVYLENAVRYKSKDETWNLRFAAPFSLKSFRLQDDNSTEERKLNRLIIEPDFYIKKKISAFWESSVSARLDYSFGDIWRLYNGFILTSYRNLQRYDAPISEEINQRYRGAVSYRNPLNQWFVRGSFTFRQSKKNVMISTEVGEDGALVINAIEEENFSDSYAYDLSGSKFLSRLNTTAKLNLSRTVSTGQQLLNNDLTEVKNTSYILGASLDTEVFSWLSATYNGNFSWYRTALENVRFQQIQTNEHTIDLFFYLNDRQYLSASNEYYWNSVLEENAGNYFLNFSYQYTFEKPKVELNFNWNNVLNTEEFVNIRTTEYSYITSNYRLRPSQVVVSLKFSF